MPVTEKACIFKVKNIFYVESVNTDLIIFYINAIYFRIYYVFT